MIVTTENENLGNNVFSAGQFSGSVANNIFEMFFRLMAFYKIQKLR